MVPHGGNCRHYPKYTLNLVHEDKKSPEGWVIYSGSHSSSETELALTSGPRLLRPLGLWVLGQDSLMMLTLEDAGLALCVQTSPDNGMISGTLGRGVWSGLAANGGRAVWSTLMLVDVYSPFTWRLTLKVWEKSRPDAKERQPQRGTRTHAKSFWFPSAIFKRLNFKLLNFNNLCWRFDGNKL